MENKPRKHGALVIIHVLAWKTTVAVVLLIMQAHYFIQQSPAAAKHVYRVVPVAVICTIFNFLPLLPVNLCSFF